MQLKSILLSCFFVLFSQQALATMPTQCPTVAELKKINNFNQLEENKAKRFYLVGKKGKFGTDRLWVFRMVMPITQATDLIDAMNKSLAALKTLSGSPKPVMYRPVANSDEGITYYCEYKNKYNYLALTVTWDELEEIKENK